MLHIAVRQAFRDYIRAAGITALAGAVLIGLSSLPAAQAQALAASSAAFEVASVRPGDRGGLQRWGSSGGRFVLENVPLEEMIAFSYRVARWQISGGPGWIGDDRFNIEAVKPEGSSRGVYYARDEELKTMLQALLADRFKLKLHRETKEGSVYALVCRFTKT